MVSFNSGLLPRARPQTTPRVGSAALLSLLLVLWVLRHQARKSWAQPALYSPRTLRGMAVTRLCQAPWLQGNVGGTRPPASQKCLTQSISGGLVPLSALSCLPSSLRTHDRKNDF